MSDNSSLSNAAESWSQYAKYYDPLQIGSIDGTDSEPHDKAIIRAQNSEYRPNRHVKGNPECTIFVARLSPKTTKDTIKEVFSKFGRLRRFRLVKDIVTGLPKGYAFIEYETERAAEEAYRKANKMFIDGQPIFVDFECERLLKNWKPRRLGGGFGGRKESGQLRFGGRDRPFRKPISLEIQQKELAKRDRREREYRSGEHSTHRYKEVDDKRSNCRNSHKGRNHTRSPEQSENKERRYKSRERREHFDKQRENRHRRDRIKREHSVNRSRSREHNVNSGGNNGENSNGKD